MAKTKQNKKTQRDKIYIYIYIVPPDAQQVDVSEAIKFVVAVAELRPTLLGFPQPEPPGLAWERPRTAHLQSPSQAVGAASLLASPLSCAPRRPPWSFLCRRPARLARPRCLSTESGPGGRRGEVCVSLRKPSPAPGQPARGSQSYLQADFNPMSCFPFPSSLPRRKMVPEAGGKWWWWGCVT